MGKIGDVLYSLPTIRELGGGILYLPESTPDGCSDLYSTMKDLLLQQPYIHEVREYPPGLAYKEQAPGIAIDYDLDLARDQPKKGLIHIVKRYMDAFGINYPNWKEPWLKVEQKPFEWAWWNIPDDYVIVNYTSRHIYNEQMGVESKVDWKRVINSIEQPKYFIGKYEEYLWFCKKYGIDLPYLQTHNLLQAALLIKHAHSVYCNQSSVLAISQSLGKTYYLDVKPFKRNCLLEITNENVLL
jgi:hypothetical protein